MHSQSLLFTGRVERETPPPLTFYDLTRQWSGSRNGGWRSIISVPHVRVGILPLLIANFSPLFYTQEREREREGGGGATRCTILTETTKNRHNSTVLRQTRLQTPPLPPPPQFLLHCTYI